MSEKNSTSQPEHADTEFEPIGGTETTETAEYEGHDFGTESSTGRGAEGTGTPPAAADATS